MQINNTLKQQQAASENMLKDLIGQINKQKKEGADLVQLNIKLNNCNLKNEQIIELMKTKYEQNMKNF